MKLRIIASCLLLFLSLCVSGYTSDDLVYDFEWLEPNYTVEIAVGETHQLLYTCSTNYTKVFSESYASNWVHYEYSPSLHVVDFPTGYSIDENGRIKGLIEGKYAIKPTGIIIAKDPENKRLSINVVSLYDEKEPNNFLETANTLGVVPTRFYLSSIADVDCFKYYAKAGDKLYFRVEGNVNFAMIKWVTYGGNNLEMIGSGNVIVNGSGWQKINIGDLTRVYGTGDYYIQFYANPNYYNYFQSYSYYTVQALLEKEIIRGDVNEDGEVNIADLNIVIDNILSVQSNSMCDINCDGEVNISDVNEIINIILSS